MTVRRWQSCHLYSHGTHTDRESPRRHPGRGLARHEIELPAAANRPAGAYCRLLWEWNAKLNLTRHTDYEKFVARDLVDSLAFARFLDPGETVLDVGTGGGVPGVVLAIVRDDLKVALCESVGKKARAVADIVAAAGAGRARASRPGRGPAGRAPFRHAGDPRGGPAEEAVEWFSPHWGAFERMLVLKGPAWVDERGEARHYGLMHDLALRKLHPIRCRAPSRKACCWRFPANRSSGGQDFPA